MKSRISNSTVLPRQSRGRLKKENEEKEHGKKSDCLELGCNIGNDGGESNWRTLEIYAINIALYLPNSMQSGLAGCL